MNCEFCKKKIFKRIIKKSETVFAIYDQNPVTKHHTIIIPYRHFKSFFEISNNELKELFLLILKLKKKFLAEDKSIKGFNLGVNFGKYAGQTINHCHFHLIPRRKNDFDLRLKKNKSKKFFWIK